MDFSKNTKISNFMNILPVGAEFLCGRKDGQTGTHDEANTRFSQFCESTLKKAYSQRSARQAMLVPSS